MENNNAILFVFHVYLKNNFQLENGNYKLKKISLDNGVEALQNKLDNLMKELNCTSVVRIL